MDVNPQNHVKILKSAWTLYAQLDTFSNRRDKKLHLWRGWVALLGILGVLFAIILQVYSSQISATSGGLLKVALITAPITASILAAFTSKIFNSNVQSVTRAGADEILKVIYIYRTFLKNRPDRRKWLEKRLTHIQHQIHREIDRELVLGKAPETVPPYYTPDDPSSDPGFKDLTGGEYLTYRLEYQLAQRIKKIRKLEYKRTIFQIMILFSGGLGTFLATMGGDLSIWAIAIVTIGLLLFGLQELHNFDLTLNNYKKVIMALLPIYDHWKMLEPEERTDAEFFQMVKSTEDVLSNQSIGSIKFIQEMLAKETLEETNLINEVLKKAIQNDNAFKKHMRKSIVNYATPVIDETQNTLEKHSDQVLGPLVEEASSELVQQELAAIGKAVSPSTNKLSDLLKGIVDEFAGVEIGHNTPKGILNDLLSRYPTTKDIKG